MRRGAITSCGKPISYEASHDPPRPAPRGWEEDGMSEQGPRWLIPDSVAALLERGCWLMGIDPTRWPRAQYEAWLGEGMRHEVRRRLAREHR